MENLPINTKSLPSRIFYSQEEDKVYVGEPGDYKEVGSGEITAGQVSYDNADSELEATNIQEAIDEITAGHSTFNLHTEDSEIAFTGDGTTANPLKAEIASGHKTPYKAIDTSIIPPDLPQLTAYGTDRVDFPNLNRIYFLNGAKWTYVETNDVV